MNRLKYHYCEI